MLEEKVVTLEREGGKLIKIQKAQIEKLEEEASTMHIMLAQAESKTQQQNEIIQDLQDQAQAMANAKDLDSELAQCHARMTEMEVRGQTSGSSLSLRARLDPSLRVRLDPSLAGRWPYLLSSWSAATCEALPNN